MFRFIEIVGGQGVGKTTFLEQLANRLCVRERRWRTFPESVVEVVSNAKIKDYDDTVYKALWGLQKVNFMRYKQYGICSTLIKKRVNWPVRSLLDFDAFLAAQLEMLCDPALDFSATTKSLLLDWHVSSIKRFQSLGVLERDAVVLFDEGPFKTNYAVDRINFRKVQPELIPIGVIHCVLDPTVNLDRIQARLANTGNLSALHRGTAGNALDKRVRFSVNAAKNTVQILAEKGIPHMDLNMNHPSIDKALTFIDKCIDSSSGCSADNP